MQETEIYQGSDLYKASLSNINDLDELSYEKFSNFLKNPKDFLLYLGSTGTGKSYFCAALRNYFLDMNEKRKLRLQQDEEEYKNALHQIFLNRENLEDWTKTSDEFQKESKFNRHHPKYSMIDCRYFTMYDFYSKLKTLINNGGDPEKEVMRLAEVDILILDDIKFLYDSEKNDWRNDILFNLIDMRCMNRKPTIITSNSYMSNLKKICEPRLFSRLSGIRNTIIERNDADLRQVYT